MEFKLLTEEVDEQLSKLGGNVALKVEFLNSNEIYEHNENVQFWAASVIKIPIACTIYKQLNEGLINANTRYKIDSKNKVSGSGISKLFDDETTFTLQDLVVLSITVSDNSASNQLVDIIGTDSTEIYMNEIGLTNTTFKHKMMIKAGKGPNLTTAEDLTKLLKKLYTKQLPGSEKLLDIMKHTELRDRIPSLIPNNILISHKPGSLPEAMHEVGIIYSAQPFIFCFFSDDQKDKNLTREVLAKCAKLCFDFSNKS